MRYNLDVRFTGPTIWSAMYMVAYGYPRSNPSRNERKWTKLFYESIAELYPCHICRGHYAAGLKATLTEKVLDGRDNLVEWVFKMQQDSTKKPLNFERIAGQYRALVVGMDMNNGRAEIQPVHFGPVFWFMLHVFSFGYGPEAAAAFQNFYLSLQCVLPCASCRRHFKGMLPRIALRKEVLTDGASLFRFIYEVHEMFNTMRGPSFEAVHDYYRKYVASISD